MRETGEFEERGLSEAVVELTEEERASLVGEVSDRRVALSCGLLLVLSVGAFLYGVWRG
ncbi:hypothetical protein RB200_30345 [Streptomyces sp. PmtG]